MNIPPGGGGAENISLKRGISVPGPRCNDFALPMLSAYASDED